MCLWTIVASFRRAAATGHATHCRLRCVCRPISCGSETRLACRAAAPALSRPPESTTYCHIGWPAITASFKEVSARETPVPAAVITRLMDRWEVPDLTEAHRVDYIVAP